LFIDLFDRHSHTGVTLLSMIGAPLMWIVFITLVRTWLELAMAIFNLERLSSHIEENTRKK
jgi:hypothetical protein